MTHWKSIALKVNARFRPGAGKPWDSMKEILPFCLERHDEVELEYFKVTFTHHTPESVTGIVVWDGPNLYLKGGSFDLNRENPIYCTPSLNVSYDIYEDLTIELLF